MRVSIPYLDIPHLDSRVCRRAEYAVTSRMRSNVPHTVCMALQTCHLPTYTAIYMRMFIQQKCMWICCARDFFLQTSCLLTCTAVSILMFIQWNLLCTWCCAPDVVHLMLCTWCCAPDVSLIAVKKSCFLPCSSAIIEILVGRRNAPCAHNTVDATTATRVWTADVCEYVIACEHVCECAYVLCKGIA